MKYTNIVLSAFAVLSIILSACAGGQQSPPTFVVDIPPGAASATAQPETGGNLSETAAAAPTDSATEPAVDFAETAYAWATSDALATRQAAPPGSTPVPTLAPTSTPILSGDGYLWWLNDPTQTVFVTGPVHQKVAVNNSEADQWAARGEACYAEGGSTYTLDPSVAAPPGAAGVLVKSGRCSGFRGWVLVAALHRSNP